MMTTHDEYRLHRVAVRKTEAHLELKLVNNLKDNKLEQGFEGLSKHASRKKKTQEKVGPTFSRTRKRVTKDIV